MGYLGVDRGCVRLASSFPRRTGARNTLCRDVIQIQYGIKSAKILVSGDLGTHRGNVEWNGDFEYRSFQTWHNGPRPRNTRLYRLCRRVSHTSRLGPRVGYHVEKPLCLDSITPLREWVSA